MPSTSLAAAMTGLIIVINLFFFVQASTDFWMAQGNWMPTWDMNEGGDSSMQVDYVRVWAL